MGIRIDGTSDLINAADGSLTVEGLSINVSGVVTASDGFKVGSAATIHSTGQFNIGVAHTLFANGNATFAGIVTASNTTISSTGIGIGAATNGSAAYPSVTISGTSGGAIHFEDDGDLLADLYGSADGLTLSTRKTNDAITFQLNSGSVGEKARFDSSGRLLIGHTATRAIAGGNSLLQIEKNSSELATFLRTDNGNGAAWLALAKSRSSAGTICQAGDQIGGIAFVPHDGTDLNHHAAEIRAYVDTGIAANDVPGYLSFRTTPDGSSTTTERLRITSAGNIDIPTGNVGIHTTDANTEHIAGAASSFVGLYMNDGFIGFPTSLNRDGGYFIATTVNALNAGPVSLGATMTLHGTWTIV